MSAEHTERWLDIYSMILDKMAEDLADPKKTYEKLGILDEYNKLEASGRNMGKMPNPMSMTEYRILMASWRKVRADFRSFGFVLGEEIQMTPEMADMATSLWQVSPWIEVFHFNEPNGLKFYGRDALTALGFLNFYIQNSQTHDPVSYMRATLERQGITKENFAERMPFAQIRNPWSDDAPTTPT